MNNELEKTNELIDLAFENINPFDYEKVFNQLKIDNKVLIEALRFFTDRVEAGTIRSKTTYMMYKALISKHDLRSENLAKNAGSVKTI